MDTTETNDQREIRAARNQALFRAVNERINDVNSALGELSGRFAIACECADTTCVEAVRIAPDEYEQIRANPRQFAVRRGHVYPEVETVIAEGAEYVVVEKIGEAGAVAESLAGADTTD